MKKNRYPQPDRERKTWLNLNGQWEFSFDQPTFDSHIEVPYPWGSPLSGIGESKNAVGYYRRSVTWNPDEERIFLCFGAVDYTCEAKINGVTVCRHKGGYARFEADVTDAWKRGESNEVTVIAEDQGDSATQTYGKQGYGDARGIWQTVWLEARPTAYIASFFVKTALSGEITYEIETKNAANGAVVAAEFKGIHAEAKVKDDRAVLSFTVKNPKWWSPDSPTLYEGTLSLGKDVVSTYFGIREIGTGVFGDKNRRYLTLNGKPIYLNGVLDQSFNPNGFFTLPSDADCRDEILRLKRIGINMARIHIKAEEPLKLYYADKLGLLIMEDLPCFWGDPVEKVRKQYEAELTEQIERDRNHPAVFYWVVFNETWGLFTHKKDRDGNETREYTDETAKWVVSCCDRVRALDPTRPVEDNSVCNADHTKTDVNTWHFYSNGYNRVKKVVDGFCDGAYVGSQENYHLGWKMEDVPCMNSECGNVWGIRGNAGMSDISWQYHYMMNEFRLHDKLCGFVFTEFHDVVNEFNGYYKIDNSDKDFGYEEYGFSLRDLHSPDYLGADYPPMTTLKPGETVTLPMFASSFSDARHGRVLDVEWELISVDPMQNGEKRCAASGSYPIAWGGYGTKDAGVIRVGMPETDGVVTLRWSLRDGEETVMTNCVFFDVEGERKNVLSLEPDAFTAKGFTRDIPAISGHKRSGLGSGSFSAKVSLSDLPGWKDASSLRIVFEASTREAMTHDDPSKPRGAEKDYMLGYRCDAGANPNSFPQTDETAYPGFAEVWIDSVKCGSFYLPDCPADSRGLLSHHYQPVDDLLDEAGSYGTLCSLTLPSRVFLSLKQKKSFTLTLKTDSGAGLSLFGRKSGRYGIGVVIEAK